MNTQMMTRRTSLTLLGAAAVTGACAARVNPTNPDIAPISFDAGAMPLGVERVKLLIRPRLAAGDTTPVDADFVVTPEAVARLWAQQRLQAVGGPYTATYIIDDASAVSRQTSEGEVIIGTIQARIVINTLYDVEEAGAGARVESELRIAGNPNMAQRQEMLHGMVTEMAATLDDQLSASTRRTLANYLKAAPTG